MSAVLKTIMTADEDLHLLVREQVGKDRNPLQSQRGGVPHLRGQEHTRVTSLQGNPAWGGHEIAGAGQLSHLGPPAQQDSGLSTLPLFLAFWIFFKRFVHAHFLQYFETCWSCLDWARRKKQRFFQAFSLLLEDLNMLAATGESWGVGWWGSEEMWDGPPSPHIPPWTWALAFLL